MGHRDCWYDMRFYSCSLSDGFPFFEWPLRGILVSLSFQDQIMTRAPTGDVCLVFHAYYRLLESSDWVARVRCSFGNGTTLSIDILSVSYVDLFFAVRYISERIFGKDAYSLFTRTWTELH